MTDGAGNTKSFGYDPDADVAKVAYPSSGQQDAYTCNPADQVSAEEFDASSGVLGSLSYLRDAASQVTEEDQTGLPGPAQTKYSYTPVNQLSSAGGNAYAYSNAENPTTFAGKTGHGYDAAGELQTSPLGSYGYNVDGERTSQTPTIRSASSLAYDAAGRLTKDTVTGIGATRYAYDGTGLLASVTTSQATNNYAWNTTTGLPLMLSDGSNDYLYGPDGTPFEQTNSAGQPVFLHHDQIGSTRLLTNPAGTAVGAFSYTPFGAPAGQTGTQTTPFGFAGEYTDAHGGLQYERARWYDPQTGAFVSRDPLSSLTRQPYTYAADNPTSLTDPSGLLFGITLQNVADAAASVGDHLTLGGTQAIRQALGWDNVNYCSSAYGDAGGIAMAAAFFVPGEGELEAGELVDEEASVLVRHYTTDEGAEGIQATGRIRPSRDGYTYLTRDRYSDGESARAGLNLNHTPTGYFEFPAPRGTPAARPVQGGTGTEMPVPGPVKLPDGSLFNRFG